MRVKVKTARFGKNVIISGRITETLKESDKRGGNPYTVEYDTDMDKLIVGINGEQNLVSMSYVTSLMLAEPLAEPPRRGRPPKNG